MYVVHSIKLKQIFMGTGHTFGFKKHNFTKHQATQHDEIYNIEKLPFLVSLHHFPTYEYPCVPPLSPFPPPLEYFMGKICASACVEAQYIHPCTTLVQSFLLRTCSGGGEIF